MVHVAIPVQDEAAYLGPCIEALRNQEKVRFTIWLCVNQPESWQTDDAKQAICQANRTCLHLLQNIQGLDVRILDRTSRGRGWLPKRGGVGYARKELMDTISDEAAADDLLVSLDADTLVPPLYLHSLVAAFTRHPLACALAARYYHPLTEDEAVNRGMLGYEIYMRFYALNMWRIRSPYSFTALGSALALPVRVYRQLGGMTPRTSGEDFYFLQKLAKHGRVLHWTDDPVVPATRKSRRVPVGTGQAIIAACESTHTDRYPLYPPALFDQVQQTAAAFPLLFNETVATPLDDFLREKTNTLDPWQPLRENNKSQDLFVRACHQRLDGLRILQFLKAAYRHSPSDDQTTLRGWLADHGSRLPGAQEEACRWIQVLKKKELADLGIAELDGLRRMLFHMEDGYRRQDDNRG